MHVDYDEIICLLCGQNLQKQTKNVNGGVDCSWICLCLLVLSIVQNLLVNCTLWLLDSELAILQAGLLLCTVLLGQSLAARGTISSHTTILMTTECWLVSPRPEKESATQLMEISGSLMTVWFFGNLIWPLVYSCSLAVKINMICMRFSTFFFLLLWMFKLWIICM